MCYNKHIIKKYFSQVSLQVEGALLNLFIALSEMVAMIAV